MSKLDDWLTSLEYLPDFMRDFHDQKDLFKGMHSLYEQQDEEKTRDKPSWAQGQIYTVDWFLWYMASRGYTLQKCRKNVEFREFEKYTPPPLSSFLPSIDDR